MGEQAAAGREHGEQTDADHGTAGDVEEHGGRREVERAQAVGARPRQEDGEQRHVDDDARETVEPDAGEGDGRLDP